jgi:hypothetical protein
MQCRPWRVVKSCVGDCGVVPCLLLHNHGAGSMEHHGDSLRSPASSAVLALRPCSADDARFHPRSAGDAPMSAVRQRHSPSPSAVCHWRPPGPGSVRGLRLTPRGSDGSRTDGTHSGDDACADSTPAAAASSSPLLPVPPYHDGGTLALPVPVQAGRGYGGIGCTAPGWPCINVARTLWFFDIGDLAILPQAKLRPHASILLHRSLPRPVRYRPNTCNWIRRQSWSSRCWPHLEVSRPRTNPHP